MQTSTMNWIIHKENKELKGKKELDCKTKIPTTFFTQIGLNFFFIILAKLNESKRNTNLRWGEKNKTNPRILHALIPNMIGPNDGWNHHTFTMDARPLEPSAMATQGVFIQEGTLAQCIHNGNRKRENIHWKWESTRRYL